MSGITSKYMFQISDHLKKEYLEKHLPYRINSMLSPDLMTFRRGTNISNDMKVKCYQDSLVLEPAFEVSIIFARSLLNFLGITYDPKTNSLKIHTPKGDDLTIKSIYPEKDFCPLNDSIVVANNESLRVIIKLANKSVAHLTATLSNENEHKLLVDARFAVYRLMLKYIPDLNKNGIWWYTQVGT